MHKHSSHVMFCHRLHNHLRKSERHRDFCMPFSVNIRRRGRLCIEVQHTFCISKCRDCETKLDLTSTDITTYVSFLESRDKLPSECSPWLCIVGKRVIGVALADSLICVKRCQAPVIFCLLISGADKAWVVEGLQCFVTSDSRLISRLLTLKWAAISAGFSQGSLVCYRYVQTSYLSVFADAHSLFFPAISSWESASCR